MIFCIVQMKVGRECINQYSTLRRFCVFSHDELVCKMALDPDKLNLGIATACYLDMAEMVDCEKKLRKSLLEWVIACVAVRLNNISANQYFYYRVSQKLSVKHLN